MPIIKDAAYYRNYRNKKSAEELPLPAIDPEDFPPHKCIQKDAKGDPVKFVEDPNYGKMCQYVNCRKPSTQTVDVFSNTLRVCDKHHALVTWIDPNAPTLKPADQPEELDDSLAP